MISLAESPLPGLFVAGTDTDVGKTIIASALLRAAHQRHLKLIPYKPVETGVDPFPRDARALVDASGLPLSLADVCLYALRLPAAPQAAADQEGITISPERLVKSARRLAALGDGLVVEAAGGLLVPYARGFLGIDLAIALGLPILLVARTGLGTINHTALSLNEIRRRHLALAGLLLVDTDPRRRPHEGSNAALIEEITGVRPLAVFPHLVAPTADDLARTLIRVLLPAALERLFQLATQVAAPRSDR